MTEKHETCGRRHSKPELVERCEERHQARLLDRTRRIENARVTPPEVYIQQRHLEGMAYDRITAGLKRDYPPPPADLIRAHEGWWVGNVVELDTRRFTNWPI